MYICDCPLLSVLYRNRSSAWPFPRTNTHTDSNRSRGHFSGAFEVVGGIKADRNGQLPDSRSKKMKAPTMAKILSAVVLVVMVGHVAANTAISCHTCEGANCQRVQLSKTQTCVDSLDYCVTIYDEGVFKERKYFLVSNKKQHFFYIFQPRSCSRVALWRFRRTCVPNAMTIALATSATRKNATMWDLRSTLAFSAIPAR